jgi:protein-tyrosine-phosphatase
VCTGNICRSVMAEALLRAALGDDTPIEVRSAGLAAPDVAPPRRVVAEMRKRGLDVSQHRSRRFTPADVTDATVVIGAARIHAWEAVAMAPEAMPHTFTYRELVRLGDRAGWRRDGESLDGWIARLHDARHDSSPALVGDDIVDPMGRSRRTFARVAADLEELTGRVAPSFAGLPVSGAPRALSWRPPNDWQPIDRS